MRADEQATVDRRKAMFRRLLVRAAWSWLMALDLAGQYLFRVRLPLLTGWVVICDRYVYDMWVEWGAYFGSGEGIRHVWAARLLRWLAPQPDVAYLLNLPAEVARSRSSTAPALRFMEEQAALYRRLASTFQAIIQDAERPAAELEDEIAYKTLTAYFDRYWTLLNALFFRNPRPLPGKGSP